MYADDTTVLCCSSDINLLFQEMNQSLHNINTWAFDNRLLINTKKTKYMLFRNNKPIEDVFLNNKLIIGTFEIESVKYFKLLGVIIDAKLKFKEHIELVVGKISRSLGIINKIKFFLTRESLFMLYYSLIFSHIYYCNIIWGSNYKTYLKNIYTIQKRFLCILNKAYGLPNFNVSIFFNVHKILTIYELNLLKSNFFFFELLHNKYLFFRFTFIINKY